MTNLFEEDCRVDDSESNGPNFRSQGPLVCFWQRSKVPKFRVTDTVPHLQGEWRKGWKKCSNIMKEEGLAHVQGIVPWPSEVTWPQGNWSKKGSRVKIIFFTNKGGHITYHSIPYRLLNRMTPKLGSYVIRCQITWKIEHLWEGSYYISIDAVSYTDYSDNIYKSA